MSARPLFDIPEGWRLLPSDEEIQWRDYAVNKRETKFDGVMTSAAGAKVRENDGCWYFRRIETPTSAPAPEMWKADSRPLLAEIEALAKERDALLSRLSSLESALEQWMCYVEAVSNTDGGYTSDEAAEAYHDAISTTKKALGSAKGGPSAKGEEV